MMFILIEDYFITTQVFNLVFYRGRGGGGQVNTVVIVKNANRKKKKKNELGQYSAIWTLRLVNRDL